MLVGVRVFDSCCVCDQVPSQYIYIRVCVWGDVVNTPKVYTSSQQRARHINAQLSHKEEESAARAHMLHFVTTLKQRRAFAKCCVYLWLWQTLRLYDNSGHGHRTHRAFLSSLAREIWALTNAPKRHGGPITRKTQPQTAR